ncbi:MAG: HAMP domain-containing protein [Pseudobdellovibrionaceae bacterium]|nr:HAMP domain-containing protein [Pseudobdellovibrionaceae bacterium]
MNSLKKKIAGLSIQGILLVSSITLLVAMMVVNRLLNSFMDMTDDRAQKLVHEMTANSKTNEEQVAQLIQETTLSKMKSIVEHDVPTLRTPFLENSASFIRRFIVDSYHLDPELLHVSFFSVQKGEIKAWQMASRQFPKGCDPRTRYDQANQSWIVPRPDGPDLVVPDPSMARLIDAEGYFVQEIFIDKERALEAIAPIYDKDSADLASLKQDGEAIGYIRYVISLDRMDRVIAAEHEKAERALQKTIAANTEAKRAIAAMGRRFEVFGLLIILASSCCVLLFSIRHSRRKAELLAQPVRQLRDAAHVISQGDYEQPVTVKSDDEIGELAEAFEIMRKKIRAFTSNLQGLVDERTRQITFEKAKMQEILDNIELGIVTIDASLTIDAQYSPYMDKLFATKSQSLAGATLQDVVLNPLRLDNDHKDRIVESLKISIGQEDLSYMANASHLPRRGQFQVARDQEARTFSIDWNPIMQDDQVSRVMLVIKDLTAELEMQRQVAAAREQNDRLMQTVSEVLRSPRERVFPFLRKARESMQLLKNHIAHQDFETALIDLHTMKGAARTLRLDSLASQVHEVETMVKHGDSEGLQSFEIWLQHYLDVVQKAFGFDSNAPTATIGDASLFQLVAQSIPVLLEHAAQSRLRVQRISIDDEILAWPPYFIETLRAILIHALNNAIDHGYALPIRAGRPHRDVEINLSARVVGDNIQVMIEDHGFGLDLDKIRQRVRERGLPRHFEEHPAEALLQDGFSTAQEVSITSGRGVGLSSIAKYVQEFGGHMAIRNVAQGSGTQLEIAIPMSRFQVSHGMGRVG